MTDTSIHYDCVCHGQVIRVSAWDDDTDVSISIFEYRKNKYSFWNRFRHAWKCITTGDPYDDEIILTQKSALDLAKNLEDIVHEQKSKVN